MQSQARYTILREIASGGTSTVFLAEDNVLRRKVALKKLHPHLLSRPDMVRRFRKEAVAVAALSHENVIKIFDYGYEGNEAFLAMEFIDGISLESLLASAHGVIPNLAALSLFHQLLDGLAAAHAQGIFHRDIKPSNVLIDRNGRLRLADFGTAYLYEEGSHTRTGSYLGTPGFSAPEQAEGKPVTDKTDIFSAGILLYRCLTGKMPFIAGSAHAVLKAIVENTPARANLVNSRLLPGLADLAGEMLAKQSDQRPSASNCVMRLDSIAASAGFVVMASRLRKLVDNPKIAAEAEAREIGERYLAFARAHEGSGKGREALRMYSLAQIFADKEGPTAKEVQSHFRARALRSKVRMTAGTALACALVALWSILGPERVTPRVAPSPLPAGSTVVSASTSVPTALPEWRRELAIPVAVPEWKKASRGDRKVSPGPESSPLRSAYVVAAHPGLPEAGPGYLWVKTTPPFARLRIDGRESGETPMTAPLSLVAGQHRLEVDREGCQPMSQEVQVVSGDTLRLRLSLPRADARVGQNIGAAQ